MENNNNECIELNERLIDYNNYVDTSQPTSLDHDEINGFRIQHQSPSKNEELLLREHGKGTSVNCAISSPVDQTYDYMYSDKSTSIDALDSGISSPTSLTVENLDCNKNKRNVSSKTEIEYDTLEILSCNQSKSHSMKCELRLPKLSICHQSPANIGGIVSRIRSLSIGVSPNSNTSSRRPSGEGLSLQSDSISPSCTSLNQDPDPMKLPKENNYCSLNFTNKNIRSQKKYTRMTHSLSCDVGSFNFNELPAKTSNIRYPSSEEAVYMPSSSPAMNRLERFLSGHIDTSTPNGALLTVINQGLRRVSESDRYLLFSKSPLRSPVDFLDSGIEHLGDSDILVTVLHHSTCYDLMPESGKLIVLDCTLPISKAFKAMEDNSVDQAPIWSSQDQAFIGVLSKEDQLHLLLLAYQYREKIIDVDMYMERIAKESLLNCIGREPSRHQLHWINPENTICSAIKRLDITSSPQILVKDGQRSGNGLYILNHKRILTFLLSASLYGLPLPSVLKTTIGVTELMMNRKVIQRYKVFLDTDLTTLLKTMDNNCHRCALVCIEKSGCKICLCTDECIGILTVDDIANIISQSSHCDPSYQVKSILSQILKKQKKLVYCDERDPVINVIKTIVQENAPFILINQDCCKTCLHSIVSSKELLNYIMKHDRCSTSRENLYLPVKRKSPRSYSCCEENQRISDMNLSGVSLDEKDEDVFNMEVL